MLLNWVQTIFEEKIAEIFKSNKILLRIMVVFHDSNPFI